MIELLIFIPLGFLLLAGIFMTLAIGWGLSLIQHHGQEYLVCRQISTTPQNCYSQFQTDLKQSNTLAHFDFNPNSEALLRSATLKSEYQLYVKMRELPWDKEFQINLVKPSYLD